MARHVLEQTFEELRRREDVAPEQVAKLEFVYLPIVGVSSRRKKPLTLHRLMVERPELFMDAIRVVFKSTSGESEPVVEGGERLAVAAYKLLEGLHVLPGQNGGQVDEKELLEWCTEVRRLAQEADRAKVAELRIGSLLAHAPASPCDKAWPHEAVRAAIEILASDDLERGIAIERFNMRGVHSKSIGEGGEQERGLARQARTWSEAMPAHPRTAAMLMRISESWNREAESADLSAAKDSLRW